MERRVKLIKGEAVEKPNASVFARVLRFLRRWMPYVAVAATVCFLLWLLISRFDFYDNSIIGGLFGTLTLLLVTFSLFYYAARLFRWTKRHLLWRVRRRLIITYLFIGLTPILLYTLLGVAAWSGLAPQAMVRLISVQTNRTQMQTLANARLAASDLARLPANADDAALQTWIDGRAAALQATLPGAQLAVWRTTPNNRATNNRASNNGAANEGDANRADATRLVLAQPAALLSRLEYDENTRGLPGEVVPNGAPLPEWLAASLAQNGEWGALSYQMPIDAPDAKDEVFRYAIASFRAAARAETPARNVVLLVTVPTNRALLKQFSDSTGLRVRPLFIRPRTGEKVGVQVNVGDNNSVTATSEQDGAQTGEQQKNRAVQRQQNAQKVFQRDQFGDPMPTNFNRDGVFTYPVFVQATDWTDGKESPKWVFTTDLSYGIMANRILGDQTTGEVWRIILIALSITFLVLEIIALLTAGWMTRAITGTVHRLYQATEFIKRGDFSHRVKVRSNDQLGELAVAFNEMSGDIEELLRERVKSVKLQREVEIAAEVQAQLFPRETPQLRTIEIAGECRAARGVAGDYYDYLQITPSLYVLALGDVSGKGISASLVMSNLQATLRAQTMIIGERLRDLEALTDARSKDLKQLHAAPDLPTATAVASSAVIGAREISPLEMPCTDDNNGICALAKMTSNVNKQLCQSTDSNRFATLFLALYDDQTRTLRYTNAGHNDAILARADGTIEHLTSGGLMVGAFDFATYDEVSISLQPDDMLLIFSDGISEATNADGEEYGEARIATFVQTNRHLSATEMLHQIFDEADEWSAGQERGDDQTLVVIKARTDGIDKANNLTT